MVRSKRFWRKLANASPETILEDIYNRAQQRNRWPYKALRKLLHPRLELQQETTIYDHDFVFTGDQSSDSGAAALSQEMFDQYPTEKRITRFYDLKVLTKEQEEQAQTRFAQRTIPDLELTLHSSVYLLRNMEKMLGVVHREAFIADLQQEAQQIIAGTPANPPRIKFNHLDDLSLWVQEHEATQSQAALAYLYERSTQLEEKGKGNQDARRLFAIGQLLAGLQAVPDEYITKKTFTGRNSRAWSLGKGIEPNITRKLIPGIGPQDWRYPTGYVHEHTGTREEATQVFESVPAILRWQHVRQKGMIPKALYDRGKAHFVRKKSDGLQLYLENGDLTWEEGTTLARNPLHTKFLLYELAQQVAETGVIPEKVPFSQEETALHAFTNNIRWEVEEEHGEKVSPHGYLLGLAHLIGRLPKQGVQKEKLLELLHEAGVTGETAYEFIGELCRTNIEDKLQLVQHKGNSGEMVTYTSGLYGNRQVFLHFDEIHEVRKLADVADLMRKDPITRMLNEPVIISFENSYARRGAVIRQHVKYNFIDESEQDRLALAQMFHAAKQEAFEGSGLRSRQIDAYIVSALVSGRLQPYKNVLRHDEFYAVPDCEVFEWEPHIRNGVERDGIRNRLDRADPWIVDFMKLHEHKRLFEYLREKSRAYPEQHVVGDLDNKSEEYIHVNGIPLKVDNNMYCVAPVTRTLASIGIERTGVVDKALAEIHAAVIGLEQGYKQEAMQRHDPRFTFSDRTGAYLSIANRKVQEGKLLLEWFTGSVSKAAAAASIGKTKKAIHYSMQADVAHAAITRFFNISFDAGTSVAYQQSTELSNFLKQKGIEERHFANGAPVEKKKIIAYSEATSV